MTSSELLNDLLKQGEQLTERFNDEYARLTANQINWRPDSRSWSIAECLDHLNTSNLLYFPIMQTAIDTVKSKPEFKDTEEDYQHTLTGNMMIKMVRADNRKRTRSPRQFLPRKSLFELSILHEFHDQHNTLLRIMNESKGLNIMLIKVYSPVNRVFKFNLGDCFAILIHHDLRHFQQITRLLQLANFPSA